MKIGDKFPVQIEGMDIGEATIEDIEDGKATLVIPATRLVVQVRQSLDMGATVAPEVDRVFSGLEDSGTNESAASEEINSNIEDVASPTDTPHVEVVGEGIHSRKSFPGEMD